MEQITLSKDAFDDMIKLLELKELKCSSCKKKLTKNNFGLIAKDNYSCDNILCLSIILTKLEGKK